MKKIKVVFFGSSIHSLPSLYRLISLDYITIVACVTQPDRPVGRKQILTPTPVADFAKTHGISLIKPKSNAKLPWHFLNPEGLENELKQVKPDLFIVCYYGQKIPADIIKLAKYGGLNIHPSLLPKYRGAAPAEWAILNGETETGVTVLTVEKDFDRGKIVAQEKEPVKNIDTAEDLYTRLFEKGAELLIKVLPDLLKNKVTPVPQDNTKSSFAPRLTKENGKINWKKEPLAIERMIRAFSPWPGTFTFVKLNHGTQPNRLKILKSHITEEKLILDSVQLEGKKPVSFKVFQKAYPNYQLV